MLVENMSLRQMLDFKPSDEDMAMLPLDVVVYLKVTMVSIEKEINYNFVRFLFNHERKDELINCMKDIHKTMFYDYSYKVDEDDTRAITIFELYSKENYTATELLLNELLNEYSHDAEVIIDLYTHDNHEYRLSNLDGIVKNDQIK